ncbi:MAG: excinuclease ABC subunit UvrC [Lachnospiraceae bacterium]|nr:excinuclease ABC subunit UvrC [Lachnospiraceae bacterium]
MFDFDEELKSLPSKPGVYIMKNSAGEIIYIGKAKNLKNRVRQYFQNSANHSAKVKSMVLSISEFEYIITDSEMEALILECSLIKKYSPKYNIMLKDDKSYPYIKITLTEEFPRIFLTRNYVRDKSKYYGPMTDVSAAKETLNIIHKLWQVRKCGENISQWDKKERPCLNYHIGLCSAPCAKLINREDYMATINEAIDFLDGKHEDIVVKMQKDMKAAAEKMDFERAAALRDKITSLERISKRQKLFNEALGDMDIIVAARENEIALIQVFFIRGGKMTGRENFVLDAHESLEKSEVVSGFIKQFYSGTAFIPKEIVIEEEFTPEELDETESLLNGLKGSKVVFTVPKVGDKRKLVELALKNAEIMFSSFGEKLKIEEERTKKAISEIASALGIEKEMQRIEAYDISNIQGVESVGSMIVFEGGMPKKSDYRKFKIKTVDGANDYASMEEVLTRRFNRYLIEQKENKDGLKFNKLPDLIFMDGGEIQVNAALGVLFDFGLEIPVCGMLKDERHRTKSLYYKGKEIYMPKNSSGFHMVTRIQDEVHRFAIGYHRKLRQKTALHSILDEISGIGDVRRTELIKAFKTVDAIKSAGIEELKKVSGMNEASAKKVYDFFREND